MRKIYVNLGSGTNIVEGWINIDKSWNIFLSKFPVIKKLLYKIGLLSEGAYRARWQGKNIIRHDVTKKLPFKSKSVDAIYSSHLLEHLTYNQAREVCQEAYRILKKDGIIRLVVPDLELYARKYVEGDRDFFGGSDKPIADLFLESLYLEWVCKPSMLEKVLHSFHKYMFDTESLTFLLKSVGFRNIRKCNFREGLCPDLKKMENRKKSIYIEAQK